MTIIDLLKALLFESVAKLYANDFYLIHRGGMELACKFRVAMYIQEMLNYDPRFKMWRYYNVDCEYNKSAYGTKHIPGRECHIQTDLNLHIRGTDEYNLLTVEFKLDDGDAGADIHKLEQLTHPDGQYRYALGCFVKIGFDGPKYTLVIDGKI